MLYHWLYPLADTIPGLNVVRYITFRTAAATLTLLVGLVLAAASVLRLGFVANFISEPVLTGFKAGIGLVIVIDQVPKLLGIHFEKGGFLHNVAGTSACFPAWAAVSSGTYPFGMDWRVSRSSAERGRVARAAFATIAARYR